MTNYVTGLILKPGTKLLIPLMLIVCSSATCNLSFNGASIPPEIQTITIQYFPNQSTFVAPSLSQVFTETLKDKFLQESNLTLTEANGDWEFSGAITRYETTPIAPTGNETTALNRLTITIKTDFLDRKHENEGWTQTFSRYEDYESTVSLSQVESELIQNISEQLADDLFQKVAANW